MASMNDRELAVFIDRILANETGREIVKTLADVICGVSLLSRYDAETRIEWGHRGGYATYTRRPEGLAE